jgi:dolichyl-phosphate-mannose-protein mannosyltransferase
LSALNFFYPLSDKWRQFAGNSGLLFLCYLINYVPYLLTEQTTFLYQYLPALLFKLLLLAAIIEHISHVIRL